MLISNSSFVATIGSGVISSEDSKFHVPAAADIPQAKARTAAAEAIGAFTIRRKA